jgi:hypothetical protein
MLPARRVVLLASLILACTRTTSPGTVAEAEAIGSTCENDRLDACVEACRDATCLDWCAGSACRVAVGEVWTCMDEVERAFEREHPEPHFSPSPDVDEATLEALAVRWFADAQAWKAAHEAALDTGWAKVCKPVCGERVASGFCERDTPDHESWSYAQLTCSAPMRPVRGFIHPMTDGFESPPDVTFTLVGARMGEMKGDALSRLVANQSPQLRSVRGCVAEAATLVFAIDLDPNGRPEQIEIVEGEPGPGGCVAAILDRDFALPAAVVTDFPRVEIGVQIRTESP